MGINTLWIVLGTWTIAGLLVAIAFGRVARNNEDPAQDAMFDTGMPVANTPNVKHFRRQKRKVAADVTTHHQAARDDAQRRAK